jgi:hypothetical protein
MVWAVSLAMAFAMVELCGKLLKNIWLRKQPAELQVSLRAFQNAQTDEDRQRLLLKSGFATLCFSLVCATLVALLAGVLFVPIWVFGWDTANRERYLLIASVAATVWWLLRVRLMQKKASAPVSKHTNLYSRLDRWLHWLALEPMAVRQLSFELERMYALPRQAPAKPGESKPAHGGDGAVYVCGLARSGTTILLNILDQAPEFRSLSYRDMPFVLAPNLWRLINRHSRPKVELTERIHGDGVLVDYDSPEAFEEVFWRTFGSLTTNKKTGYGGPEPTPYALATFADYRALVTSNRHQPDGTNGTKFRYLSKNNNNLLRLHSLSQDPTATILLVYRNPLDTARSLHRLHKRLCKTQVEDPFSRTYMTLLGHHEFGLSHLPFSFAIAEMDSTLEPNDLNYWLDYWTVVHQYILTKTDLRFHMINHDAMRAMPEATLRAIFSVIGHTFDVTALANQIAAPASLPNGSGFSPILIERALNTYNALLVHSKNLHLEQ